MGSLILFSHYILNDVDTSNWKAMISMIKATCLFNFRREQWPLFSTYSCWQQLVTQTKNLSKDHAALSEVYSTHLVSRLGEVMEDVQRIYRRVNIIHSIRPCCAET